MTPKLLPEIFDHIIDQLRDDKPSLTNCSRVCRDWFPRSNLNLHRKLKTALLVSSVPGIIDFSSIPQFPRIAGVVQELHVSGFETMLLDVTELREVLSLLHLIKSITFDHLTFFGGSPVGPPRDNRPKLKTLRVIGPQFHAPVHSVIACFEEIDSMHVVRYRDVQTELHEDYPVPQTPIDPTLSKTRVRSLTVEACDSAGTRILLDQLCLCVDQSTLSELELKRYAPCASLALCVNRFLSTFNHLQRLKLFIAADGALNDHIQELDPGMPDLESTDEGGLAFPALAKCTELESIHLTMPMIYHRLKAEHNCKLWLSCMGVLRLAPQSIRTIRLVVECGLRISRFTASEYFEELDWKRFNSTLTRLHNLKDVYLSLGELPWNVAAGASIEEHLNNRTKQLLEVSKGKSCSPTFPSAKLREDILAQIFSELDGEEFDGEEFDGWEL